MNLARYVKCLKGHVKNKRISDEKFLNSLLKCFVDAGEVDNRYGNEFYLDKSRTSLLMTENADVPEALRAAINLPNIYEWTEGNFKEFIDKYLNQEELSILVEEVWQMVEAEPQIANKDQLKEKKTATNIFLADVLIEAIKLQNNGIHTDGEIIRNGTYFLDTVNADIFKFAFRKRAKDKNIVVIPVDDRFNTHITRKYENDPFPLVSERTIHGQWLLRWEKSGEDIDELRERILRDLESRNIRPKTDGRFPVGTIATIESATTIFYLLVISAFDEKNNAHTTKEKIGIAVAKLSNHYDCCGDGRDMYIPLMGTGKSRANLSLQESYDLIVDYYQQNKSLIQGNIHIVIYKGQEKLIKTGGEKKCTTEQELI